MTPAIVPLLSGLGTTLIILLVLIGVLIFWLVGMYNSLVSQRNQVQESWHQVDVELQRRYDLIPNLVETIKAYAGHERNTLEEVVRLRNQAASMAQPGALPTQQRAAAEAELSQAVSKLLVTVEAYPELKSNSNFQDLQRQLAETEDRIAAGRRFYNANVRGYNTKVESFPSNLIANMFKFEKATYFEVNDPEVRASQRVDFGTMGQTGPTQSQLNATAAGQGAIPAPTYQQAYPSAQPQAIEGQQLPATTGVPGATETEGVTTLPTSSGGSAPQSAQAYVAQGQAPTLGAAADARAEALNDPSQGRDGQQTIFGLTEAAQAGAPNIGINPADPNNATPLPGEYGSIQKPGAPLTDPYGNPVNRDNPYGR